MSDQIKMLGGKRSVLVVLTGLAVVLLFGFVILRLQAQRDSVADVIQILKTGTPELKKRAAWALGERENPTAVSSLEVALKDQDPEVRTMAAWALGEIKETSAIPELIEALSDASLLVREMVVRALGEIKDPQPIERLVDMLEDSNREIRAAAIWALGEIGTHRALALVRRSQQDEDELVKSMANRVIMARNSKLEVQEELVATDSEIKKHVDRALKENANSKDLTNLVAKLGHDSALIRMATAYSLGRIGDVRAVDALIAAVRDPDPDVRAMVVWALDEINIP